MSSIFHSSLKISLLLGCALSIACASEIGGPQAGTVDASPITFDEPDPDGKQTASNCKGVDVRGECRGEIRMQCDVKKNELIKADCGAMGSECLMDKKRGFVTCTPPDDPSSVNECLAMGSFGVCTADKNVEYCLGTKDSDIEVQVCSGGEECQFKNEKCAKEGAYCCDVEPESVCDALGSLGKCEDNKRIYCEGGIEKTENCETAGQNCFVFDTTGEAKCDSADIGP